MRIPSFSSQVLGMALLAMTLAACNGGGDNGPSSSAPVVPITYTGSTNAAVLSPGNAFDIAAQVVGGEYTESGNLIRAQYAIESSAKANATIDGISNLGQSVVDRVRRSRVSSMTAARAMSQEYPCELSGSVRITSDLNTYNVGNITLTFISCRESDIYINGSVSMAIRAYSGYYDTPTDFTVSFNNVYFSDETSDATVHGTLQTAIQLDQQKETSLLNVVTQNNQTGRQTQAENMSLIRVYDNIISPTRYSLVASGRFYHSDHGFVDISTVNPLNYSSINQSYPDAGGPLVLSGAGDRSLRILPVTAASVALIADFDGDGEFESRLNRDWVSQSAGTWGPVVNEPPVARIPVVTSASVNIPLTLDGSLSSDPEAANLTYRWSLTAKPATSTASLSSIDQVTSSFTPDVAGTYEVSLIVNDGKLDSTAASMSVVIYDIESLSYSVLDAEYSQALDKIVMVSAAPSSAVHIYDPLTKLDTPITLSLPPTSVSVSPDGHSAAVGHDGWISYIDLDKATLVKTLAVSADVLDVVLAGNGYAYAFPRRDQWTNVHAVNIQTGEESLSTGMSIYAGTVGKLHPNGTRIYGANNGLSPDDIETYDISAGNLAYLYNSPYHGDYPMCGDLWISEDGLTIFTKCGYAFRASTIQAEDMKYRGTLPSVSMIQHLDHSKERNQVALIQQIPWWLGTGNEDQTISIFEASFLTPAETFSIPDGRHGRFVFFSSDGSRRYVITQDSSIIQF